MKFIILVWTYISVFNLTKASVHECLHNSLETSVCVEYKERQGDRDIVLRVLTNVVLLKDRTSLVTAYGYFVYMVFSIE